MEERRGRLGKEGREEVRGGSRDEEGGMSSTGTNLCDGMSDLELGRVGVASVLLGCHA